MARLKSKTVAVEGLDELRKELRRLDDPGLIDGLKDANFEVAELVTRAAQAGASTRLERAAARSLKPSRQAARAQVTGGGAAAPFFGGAEFGAARGQTRQRASGTYKGFDQFQPWRGNGMAAGYFLYPAIRDKTPEIVELYGDAMDKLTAQAFPQ